jgi:hypothetical protein
MDDKNQAVSVVCSVDDRTQGMTLPGKKRSFIDKFPAIQEETVALANDHTLRMGAPTIPLAFIQRRLLAIQKETIVLADDHALGMGLPEV